VPAVRQLLPHPLEDLDPVEAHAAAERPRPPGRPWLLVNMVASADGATAIDGVSGGLGGPADKAVFRAIRGSADVVLAAAGTVRAEGYGPPKTHPDVQAARRARGQQPHPRIAIVSGSLDLDPATELFADAAEPPLVFTTAEAAAAAPDALAAVADLRPAGTGSVDLVVVLAELGRLGVGTVACEGGPSLNGQLIAADLVDELDLTTSPLLVGGDSRRAAVGGDGTPRRFAIAHLWEADGLVFTRYVRDRVAAG
jgi:riboflavin biosynthesis pyrimidine reductase